MSSCGLYGRLGRRSRRCLSPGARRIPKLEARLLVWSVSLEGNVKNAWLACVLLLGCQARIESPAESPGRAESAAAPDPELQGDETRDADATFDDDPLVNRVWERSEESAATEPPGRIQVFLSNGTLLSDSCWETHRLSEWSREPAGGLRWVEDGAEIRANVVALSESELVLRLHLVSGDEDQRFVPAPVPYVCPDIPR